MTDQEIKVLLAEEVLSKLDNGTYEWILRYILFDPENKINWSRAKETIARLMPELDMAY